MRFLKIASLMFSVSMAISALFSVTAYAAIGFQNGNNLQIVELNGTVNVQCQYNYGINTRTYSCDSNIVTPGAFDYFTAGPTDADHVTLVATHEDGKQVKKSLSYSQKSGRSDQVNLLVNTLFQRALLDVGNNSVEYTLLKNGKTIANGTFKSVVTEGSVRQCPFTTILSSNCNDWSGACDQYFWQNQNCQ